MTQEELNKWHMKVVILKDEFIPPEPHLVTCALVEGEDEFVVALMAHDYQPGINVKWYTCKLNKQQLEDFLVRLTIQEDEESCARVKEEFLEFSNQFTRRIGQ